LGNPQSYSSSSSNGKPISVYQILLKIYTPHANRYSILFNDTQAHHKSSDHPSPRPIPTSGLTLQSIESHSQYETTKKHGRYHRLRSRERGKHGRVSGLRRHRGGGRTQQRQLRVHTSTSHLLAPSLPSKHATTELTTTSREGAQAAEESRRPSTPFEV
jgi:hypothetical protein